MPKPKPTFRAVPRRDTLCGCGVVGLCSVEGVVLCKEHHTEDVAKINKRIKWIIEREKK